MVARSQFPQYPPVLGPQGWGGDKAAPLPLARIKQNARPCPPALAGGLRAACGGLPCPCGSVLCAGLKAVLSCCFVLVVSVVLVVLFLLVAFGWVVRCFAPPAVWFFLVGCAACCLVCLTPVLLLLALVSSVLWCCACSFSWRGFRPFLFFARFKMVASKCQASADADTKTKSS